MDDGKWATENDRQTTAERKQPRLPGRAGMEKAIRDAHPEGTVTF